MATRATARVASGSRGSRRSEEIAARFPKAGYRVTPVTLAMNNETNAASSPAGPRRSPAADDHRRPVAGHRRKFCSTGQGNTTVVTKTSFAEIALKHGTFILKLPETPFNGERATSHGEAESIFKSSSRW
jgi:hypothetical protein